MFKLIRIFILLLVLVGVTWGTWQSKSRSVSWKSVLPLNIYLINADGGAATAEYIRSLKLADFKPIEAFMKEEAARYGRATKASVEVRMGGVINEVPPAPPDTGRMLDAISWSLRMRWWAYREARFTGPDPQVRLFLLYHDPAKLHKLPHSTGLQKGLLGRVNVFAASEMAAQNNVVIVHEFLHTLGASDKYDPFTNLPLFPEGYAIPAQIPLLPQQYAEIMGGRTPVSQHAAEIPGSLSEVLIGEKTAMEIRWLEN